MTGFLERIFLRDPWLATSLVDRPGPGGDPAAPLVVVDAEGLLNHCFVDVYCGAGMRLGRCSPGPRRVFVEFGRPALPIWEPNLPDSHGWLFEGMPPGPGAAERLRATLVVEHHRSISGSVAMVDLELDERGRPIGWPSTPPHAWASPDWPRRVVGGFRIEHILYPALVALERLAAEGDSIAVRNPSAGPGTAQAARRPRPPFSYLVPSERPPRSAATAALGPW